MSGTRVVNYYDETGALVPLQAVRADLSGGERDDYKRHLTMQKSEYVRLVTNATTQQVTGPAIVVAVIVGVAGTGSTVQLIDYTSGTTPVVLNLDTTAVRRIDLGVEFQAGLRIITAGTAAADITVLYQRPNVE